MLDKAEEGGKRGKKICLLNLDIIRFKKLSSALPHYP
jgi:hypothetical protein